MREIADVHLAERPAAAAGITPAASPIVTPGRFLALDFETADYGPDSACAVSAVTVEGGEVVQTWTALIRPPRSSFVFTYLHGISWARVRNKPTFEELWPELEGRMAGVDFVAAHNAAFDRSVMHACCHGAALAPPDKPFLCTVKLARSVWNLRPATLADVCRHLRIPLKHHDAESDATACARILMRARELGHEYPALLKRHRLGPAR